jgi:heterotetrameric sarcosine oxidase delta subunit
MLRIDCPYCGTRDEPEFSFGGPAHQLRPDFECTDREWAEYLFVRDNPRGAFRERWCHSFGCGRWFNAIRDTVTHEFVAVYRLEQAQSALPAAEPA